MKVKYGVQAYHTFIMYSISPVKIPESFIDDSISLLASLCMSTQLTPTIKAVFTSQPRNKFRSLI